MTDPLQALAAWECPVHACIRVVFQSTGWSA